MNAVETHEVAKRYGALLALRDVSLEISAGTLTLVCGPNGAGKSTLLRVLGGLTRPTTGSVRLLDRDPFGRDAATVRGKIGWLGTGAGLYTDLTVEENLEFAAALHGVERTRVAELIDRLGLSPVRARPARALSDGYRRRTGLARALVHEPEILLLDEPWNGLDDEASNQLVTLLRELRDRGGTIVVAAHRAPAGADIANRVIPLESGRVVERETSG